MAEKILEKKYDVTVSEKGAGRRKNMLIAPAI